MRCPNILIIARAERCDDCSNPPFAVTRGLFLTPGLVLLAEPDYARIFQADGTRVPRIYRSSRLERTPVHCDHNGTLLHAVDLPSPIMLDSCLEDCTRVSRFNRNGLRLFESSPRTWFETTTCPFQPRWAMNPMRWHARCPSVRIVVTIARSTVSVLATCRLRRYSILFRC